MPWLRADLLQAGDGSGLRGAVNEISGHYSRRFPGGRVCTPGCALAGLPREGKNGARRVSGATRY